MKRWLFVCLIFVSYPLVLSAEKNPFNGFIENKGQWDNSVKFRKKVPHGFLLLQDAGWVYYLSNTFDSSHDHLDGQNSGALQESAAAGVSQAISTTFVGANKNPTTTSMEAQSYYHNFFLGTEDHWASSVPEFNEVQYCDLYEGIDLKMVSYGGAFKYDLIVSAGGNPGQIAMEWKGCGEVYLQNDNLIVETEFGQMIEQKPFAYQLINEDTVEVPARFSVDSQQVSFEFPDGYDEDKTLIIDPLLIFSTYSGSSTDNWGNTATFDKDGNTYAGGIIFGASTGIFVPSVGAFQEDFKGEFDVVLMKFDSTGSDLLFATYLGGEYAETPISLIVNSKNELVMMGTTCSPDFPTTSNAYQRAFGGGKLIEPLGYEDSLYRKGVDIFVSILTSDGTALIASSFLGGSENDGIIAVRGALTLNYGDQFRGEVNLDENDNIYIASNSSSPDFPMTNQIMSHSGYEDGLLVKMDAQLSAMKWGTFIGGDTTDVLFSVKPDGKGGVFVAGGTMSQALPFEINGWKRTNSGGAEGILLHFNESISSVDAATFLGTDKSDQAYFVELDGNGDVYVLGQTKGNYYVKGDRYINPGSGQFLQKFNPDLRTTQWSTVFGSGTLPSNISPTAFLVSDCNNIYISGWGGSSINQSSTYNQGNTFGMPLTPDAFQSTTDGGDFYLIVFEPDAADVLYATYFGGNPGRDHVDGGTSRFDKRGVAHHAVCASCKLPNSTAHGVFPTTEGAWSETNNSDNCNLGVFKFDLSTLSASFATNTPDLQNPDIKEGCAPFEFLFTNESVGGETYFWDLGDGATSTNSDTVRHTYQSAGEYTITLTVTNPNTCKNLDVTTRQLVLTQGTYTLSPSATICYGESIQLEATGGTSYYWTPGTRGLSSTDTGSPTASPNATTTYFVEIYNDQNKCTFIDSLTVNVLEEITISSEIEAIYNCSGVSEYNFTGSVQGTDLAYWDFGDGTQTQELVGIHEYASEGTFTTRLIAPNELCVEEVAEVIKVGELMVPNAFSPNGDGVNDRFEIQYIQPMPVTIVDRTGKVVYQNNEYTNQWDGDNLPTGIYYYDVVLPDFTTCNGWVHLLR
jgi:gliding motility-associated-like protein